MIINYPVKCDLLDNEPIDMDTCFDIHMVVAKQAPKWTAPERIFTNRNETEVYAICNKCKYHRND